MSWEEFKSFLVTNNIYSTAIGLIIGLFVQRIVTSFVDSIVTPIIEAASTTTGVKLDKQKIKIFGIDFKLGQLLKSLIEFTIVILMIYQFSVMQMN